MEKKENFRFIKWKKMTAVTIKSLGKVGPFRLVPTFK